MSVRIVDGDSERQRHRAGRPTTAPSPEPLPTPAGAPIARHLADAGVDRRSLLKWATGIAVTLGLPAQSFASQFVAAAATKPRLPVLWLNGQECTGDMESFLRSTRNAPSDLLLDQISLDYSELLMAAAGSAAEEAREKTMAAYGGKYVVIVDGSIPTAQNGVFCTVGGRSFASLVTEAAGGGVAVIAAGTCASYGGLPAATGGVTGATSVSTFLGSKAKKLIRLPGCPVNGETLTATLMSYVALGTWPATDSTGRPTFAYGKSVHSQCERRKFYESELMVRAWGDAGHQKGWCLKEMGCRGPDTRNNCPTVKWNGGTSWPVGAGGRCVGCASTGFWDRLDKSASD